MKRFLNYLYPPIVILFLQSYAFGNVNVLENDKHSVKPPSNPLSDLMLSSEWDTYFPYRWGYDLNSMTRVDDFYTYEKFEEAIETISKYELLIERRCGTNQVKISHTDVETGITKVVSKSLHFDAAWNETKPLIKEKVFYKDFLAEGSRTTRKRELAAFLANISHETTGGPAVGNTYEWGLFFREEGENTAEPPNDYVSPSEEYPPVSGKSYHGRGPIQLSYNYNYGLASEHIFGDKSILLNNPELVSEDAKTSLMTAIWFWMTPQSPKPSAHDVMAENWTPTEEEITWNRFPGLGMTINIINGGVECNQAGSEEKLQVQDRINYYKRYTDILNVSTDLDGGNNCDTCGCTSMTNYANGGLSESCSLEDIPFIKINAIAGEPLINNSTLSSINVITDYSTDKGEVSNFEIKIDEETYKENNLSWSPRFFRSYTLDASVDINDTPYDDHKIINIYDDTGAIDCNHILVWEAQDYVGNSIVKHSGKIYKAKFYNSTEPTETTNDYWDMIGTCLSNDSPTLSVTSQELDTSFRIKITANDDIGLFFIDFYVDDVLQESFNPRDTNTDLILEKKHAFLFTPSSSGTHVVKIIVYDKHGLSASYTEKYNKTLSFVEHELTPLSIGFYPNPFYDVLTIMTNENQKINLIEFFDLLGKELFIMKDLNSSSHQINLSHLKDGLYLVKIKVGTSTIIRKVIKK